MDPEYKVLTYKGYAVFQKLKMVQPQRQLKPFQENEACFMFVNHGDFSLRTPDRLLGFQEGQGLLTKCFNFFIETTEEQRANSETMEVIGIYLFPAIVEELLEIDLSVSKHNVNYNAKRVPIDGLLNNFKDSINLLLDNPELADEAILRTKLREFILLLSKTENAATHLDFLSAMFKHNPTDFTSTISSNLYTNLSVTELAQLCGMSVSSFKRKFTETYSQSPRKYLDRMKLQKAAELLKSSTTRISDIAYDCGYETISTFNRSFKSQFQQSPTEFRLGHSA
jgi:AraC-like DNA-binding protein